MKVSCGRRPIRPVVDIGRGPYPICLRLAGINWHLSEREALALADQLHDTIDAVRSGIAPEEGQ
ncbi:hypothetical protein RND64_05695 [Gordonia sp. w5E2]|uniref:Uncharacterized protein n=1 Tax=Gordonia jacobaea TaxID=122202 RepID=A0ABR5IG76_9ACTN|nr:MULTISPECIES: hypothetical protein [Gordonia]KNA92732.1 hypothetical protein ABW18_05570 [Gordonia jacobaea]SKY40496.1 Uncharacterised protein [Mycobacteroides abscessus subsp. abscessus]